MYLTLSVTSSQGPSMGMDATKVFTEAGGTIGRVAGNDWVLPDEERFVSGLHVIIRYIGGSFSLEDVSTNGTFINGDPEPVGARNEPAILKSGDMISIGDYQVYVTIVEGDSPSVSAQPAQAIPDFMESPPAASDPTVPPVPAPQPAPGIAPEPPGIGAIDPLELLGDVAPTPQQAPPTIPDHAPAVSEAFIPPSSPASIPDSGGDAIPDDWDLTGFSPAPAKQAAAAQIPEPAPAAVPEMPTAERGPADRGPADRGPAGGAAIPSGAEGEFGELMPMVVQGMMDILKSRSEVKNQFRVAVTTIKPSDNNPLKFSPTAEAAMEHLFTNRQPGYLDANEAFAEAFADIKAHELAMVAGMRAAFEHMLKQFSPDVLEERFEAGGKRVGIMGMSGKSRYWDYYRDFFERLTRDSEDNFRHLFGEEFAEAYEQQMQQLKRR